ncbi:MAG: hypothetical protein IJ673_11840, partial [Treponema sp.]|nr:hypothetical protein [Treponema sp.]
MNAGGITECIKCPICLDSAFVEFSVSTKLTSISSHFIFPSVSNWDIIFCISSLTAVFALSMSSTFPQSMATLAFLMNMRMSHGSIPISIEQTASDADANFLPSFEASPIKSSRSARAFGCPSRVRLQHFRKSLVFTFTLSHNVSGHPFSSDVAIVGERKTESLSILRVSLTIRDHFFHACLANESILKYPSFVFSVLSEIFRLRYPFPSIAHEMAIPRGFCTYGEIVSFSVVFFPFSLYETYFLSNMLGSKSSLSSSFVFLSYFHQSLSPSLSLFSALILMSRSFVTSDAASPRSVSMSRGEPLSELIFLRVVGAIPVSSAMRFIWFSNAKKVCIDIASSLTDFGALLLETTFETILNVSGL